MYKRQFGGKIPPNTPILKRTKQKMEYNKHVVYCSNLSRNASTTENKRLKNYVTTEIRTRYFLSGARFDQATFLVVVQLHNNSPLNNNFAAIRFNQVQDS